LLELAFLVVLDQRVPHEHRVLAEIGNGDRWSEVSGRTDVPRVREVVAVISGRTSQKCRYGTRPDLPISRTSPLRDPAQNVSAEQRRAVVAGADDVSRRRRS
jgi:hypothetical protein